MDVIAKDKEFAKVMEKANPQVKYYLNSVLSNIEQGRDMNLSLKQFFSDDIKKELKDHVL